MDSLRFIKRNEEKFYCFIEICESVFPNTPRSTVRNWLKALKIESVVCTPDERSVFRTANPTLCGAFGLVSHADLEKLIEY